MQHLFTHNFRRQIVDNLKISINTLPKCRFVQTADVCIVDDASLLSEPGALLLPLELRTRCLVLVGDSQQRAECQRQSLFDRIQSTHEWPAKERSSAFRLCRQYRMLADIAAWPNRAFYNGRLQNADGLVRSTADRCPLRPYTVYDLAYQQQYLHAGSDRLDSNEVNFVVGMLKVLAPFVSRTHSVGIIAPHQAYANKLMAQLRYVVVASSHTTTDTKYCRGGAGSYRLPI